MLYTLLAIASPMFALSAPMLGYYGQFSNLDKGIVKNKCIQTT